MVKLNRNIQVSIRVRVTLTIKKSPFRLIIREKDEIHPAENALYATFDCCCDLYYCYH